MTGREPDLRSQSASAVSYVLPVRRATLADPVDADLGDYLRWLASRCEVIVVDGSPPDVFAAHAAAWGDAVVHCAPDSRLSYSMGKVNGVITGVRRASHDWVVIADDDVRYDEAALTRVVDLLDQADVVRPQNYFDPLPWHAVWDTARTLLNRATSRDWPGTLGVRRSTFLRAGAYDGDVMFENLELVRTIEAAGGREVAPLDLFVRRLPPTVAHFWSQRVRQAYDELARPPRLALFLALGPAVAIGGRRAALALAAAAVGTAEVGRRRGGGSSVFPFTASLLAPCWVAERAVTSWLAVLEHLRFGGVRYGGGVVPRAANSRRELRRRSARAAAAPVEASG